LDGAFGRGLLVAAGWRATGRLPGACYFAAATAPWDVRQGALKADCQVGDSAGAKCRDDSQEHEATKSWAEVFAQLSARRPTVFRDIPQVQNRIAAFALRLSLILSSSKYQEMLACTKHS
jgi:hypothetical protein